MDGQTVGLVILGLVQIIQFLVIKRNGNASKGFKYNPHPPGEAVACKEHKAAMLRIEDKIDKQGERIGFIEGKLNGRQ